MGRTFRVSTSHASRSSPVCYVTREALLESIDCSSLNCSTPASEGTPVTEQLLHKSVTYVDIADMTVRTKPELFGGIQNSDFRSRSAYPLHDLLLEAPPSRLERFTRSNDVLTPPCLTMRVGHHNCSYSNASEAHDKSRDSPLEANELMQSSESTHRPIPESQTACSPSQ